MHEQLIDESVRRPEKLWRLSVNKKWILLAVGVVVVTISLIAILTALSTSNYDNDPPGTPMPRKCGQPTDESKWPWMAEIYARNYPDWDHTIAQGTLINDRYVLSSAYELNEHELSHLRILLAETTFIHNVADSYFDGRVYRDVIEKQFMESNPNTVLLRMDRPVTFNGRIQPICLPWVQPQIPQQLLILAEVNLSVVSSSVLLVEYEQCFAIWYSVAFEEYGEEKSTVHMCAKKPDNNQNCYALRGSPLLGVYRDGEKDRFVQYGIKYYGDCTKGLQMYSNVTRSMEWIQQTVMQNYQEV